MLALSHLNDDGTTVATPATDANAPTPAAPSAVTTSSSASATTTSPAPAPAAPAATYTTPTGSTPPTVGPKNSNGSCPTGFPWTDSLRQYDCVQCPTGYGYDAAQGLCMQGLTAAPTAPGATPFYKKPWFWAALGGVAVVATGTVMFVRRKR